VRFEIARKYVTDLLATKSPKIIPKGGWTKRGTLICRPPIKTVRNGFAAGYHLAPFAPLSTRRLALVALSTDYAPALFAYASDPAINCLAAWTRYKEGVR